MKFNHLVAIYSPTVLSAASRMSVASYTPPSLTSNKGQALPGLTVPRPKIPKGKKLKELRTEAVRVGFKHCYQMKDYVTILVVAEMIPESVLNEDEQLQMIYDTAVTRSGGGE